MTKTEQRSLAGKAWAAKKTREERQQLGRQLVAARWKKREKQRAIKVQSITEAAVKHPERYGDLLVELSTPGAVEQVYTEFQRRKQDEVLPGPNPYQVARDHPERRWAKAAHDLSVLMRSVRENADGDILHLTRRWSPAARRSYCEQLQDICATLEIWIVALEWREKADGATGAV